MKSLLLLLVAFVLAGCGSVVGEGSEGPPGPQGPAGVPGPQGPAGPPLSVAGGRLVPLDDVGDDNGSRVPSTWLDDTERGERCRFRDVGLQEPGGRRCIPDFVELTTFSAWENPDCTGHRAGSGPNTLVRLLPDGSFWETTVDLPHIYLHAGGPTGPCVQWDESIVPPPYHRWEVVPVTAFVGSTLTPVTP